MDEKAYDPRQIVTQFNVVTTGPARTDENMAFAMSVEKVLGSGFSVNEALGLMAAIVNPDFDPPPKAAYTGYRLDDALDTRVRLSLWGYVRTPLPARAPAGKAS